MKQFYQEDTLEAGIDEVARGCLAGRVYSATVIWPQELDPEDEHLTIRDSKKLSPKRRQILKDYIEENAIDFSIGYEEASVVDDINIRNATFSAMHKAIKNLNVEPEFLLVDGNAFNPYYDDNNELIPHKCFIQGDAKYISIAAASILAKVYHDDYIDQLCDENPELEQYGWRTNMCYGTEEHINAIKKYGLTEHHRKTFGVCQDYVKN